MNSRILFLICCPAVAAALSLETPPVQKGKQTMQSANSYAHPGNALSRFPEPQP